jgi:ABC-2 type transport system ATP-binding protein
MTTVVEARDLHKTFRPSAFGKPVQALRGVSFAVAEGECFGYLGPNGAGKTTTMKVLTGLMTPTQGEVALLGGPPSDASARGGLGYLPENPYFYEHLTPLEALEFYGALSGVPASTVKERAPALLERVRLSDAAGRRIRGFSKGMRQRFGLAAALIHDPALLMLDEPLSGLDPAGRRLVKEIILEERNAGRTVFLCSHVLADVQELCDRVVIVHRGQIAREGTMQELLEAGPRSFELVASHVPAELKDRIRHEARLFREAGDTITAHLDGAEPGPELAAAVHAGGGRVLSLVPERENLEAWFVRVIQREGGGGDA